MRIERLRELGYHKVADLAMINLEDYYERNNIQVRPGEPDTASFVWDRTPEGGSFWVYVSNEREIQRAIDLRPDLFVEDEEVTNKNYKVSAGGLLKEV